MIYRDTILKSDLGHSRTELVPLPTRLPRFLGPRPARIATFPLFSRNIPDFNVTQQLANVLQSEIGRRVFLHPQQNHFARRINPGKYTIAVRRTAKKRLVRSISPEMKRRTL